MLSTRYFQHYYVPARVPGPEEKVLLVFHGLGDSLNGFTWMPQELRLDNLSYLLVNAPDPYYGGYSWFDFQGDAVPGILRSRGLIQSLIQEVMSQGIKSTNILLFGFSQGSLMVLDAGLRSDVLLGGICGVSGWLAFQEEYPAAFSPYARKQNFLVTHGLRDPLLPFKASKAQAAYLVSQGIDLTFRTYDKEHTILPEELEHIREWLIDRLKV